jgi:uncharacterized protein
MKVLILAGQEKIKKAEAINALCIKFGASASVYDQNKGFGTGLTSCLFNNDLILIVWDNGSPCSMETVFSTGYCIGSEKAFVLYSDTIQEVPFCNGRAVIISKFNDLKSYIETEVEQDKKKKSIEAAKTKIRGMGFELSINDLVEVVSEGESLAVKQFIKAGFSSDSRDKNGVSLLNMAIRKGHANIATILLEAGADINTVSGDRGNTPLMDAAAESNPEILIRLIRSGADMDLKSKSGQTALVLAVGCQSEDAALVLIESGADIEIKDDLGMSARKYAELFKLKRVLKLMDKNKE